MNPKLAIIAWLCLAICVSNSPFKVLRPTPHNIGNNTNQAAIPDKIFAAEIHYSRIPHQYW